jgi:hypothetical protein
MVDFIRTRQVETEEPVVKVDAGLKEGRYTFQLTVIDKEGNRSKAARINVEVRRNVIVVDPRLVDPVIRQPVTPISPITPVGPVGPIRPIRPIRR